MSNPSDNDQRLDPLNEYLDGDLAADGQPVADLSGIPNEEIARHLLVVGIVRQLGHDTEEMVRGQVREGMVAVNQVIRETRHIQIRRGLFSTFAAAAAITVATLILWGQPADLGPVIERMQAYLRADQDRQYSMQAESRGPGFDWAGEIDTELCVRGNDKFLMSFSGNLFGNQWVMHQGFDGRDYWVVMPAIAFPIPVLVSEKSLAECWVSDRASLFQEFGQGLDRVEIGARIFALLDDLKKNYRVGASAPDSNSFRLSQGQLAILAKRHAQTNTNYPKTIEFLLDTASGTVHEIIVEYLELPGWRGRMNPFRKIRYRLKSEFPRDDTVYEHWGHHDGTRQVVRLEEPKDEPETPKDKPETPKKK